MADIRNCPRCGRIFTYLNKAICASCMDEEEQEFKKVKEFIYDNPGASMIEVSKETEVSVDKIMRFLRDERLEISSDNSNLMLQCERCGIPVKSGRFCNTCKNDMSKSFKKEFGLDKKVEAPVVDDRPKDKNDKMYTATRRK